MKRMKNKNKQMRIIPRIISTIVSSCWIQYRYFNDISIIRIIFEALCLCIVIEFIFDKLLGIED